MKVVIVGRGFPPDQSNLRALARRVELKVYGASPIEGSSYRGPTPNAVASRTLRPLIVSDSGPRWVHRGLWKALEEDRPEVLHVIMEPWGVLAVQAATWARLRERTAVVIHGCDGIWWHGPATEQCARRVLSGYTLRRADGYAGENAENVRLARRSGLPPAAPTAVTHTNPRDGETFRPAVNESERSADRRLLGLPASGLGIGFMGRLIPEKGPLLFLEALRRAGLDRSDAAWSVMVGTGPLESDVSEHAARAGVVYLTKLDFPDQVAAFCRSIDVLAVPSFTTDAWDEQGPRVVAEAMLSGCIVVGARCGAVPEMIDGAGFLVEERSVDDLATGIHRALDCASDRHLRERARTTGLSRFSGEASADALVDLWERALGVRTAAT